MDEIIEYWRVTIPHPAPKFTGVDKLTGIEFENSVAIVSDTEHIRYAKSIQKWKTKQLTDEEVENMHKARDAAYKIHKAQVDAHAELIEETPVDIPEIGNSTLTESNGNKLDFMEPPRDPEDEDEDEQDEIEESAEEPEKEEPADD